MDDIKAAADDDSFESSSANLPQVRPKTNNKIRFELLIMSEAGKPIYSYSKREDAVTLMPLCSTLMNYAKEAQKETLLSMKTADNLVITFATKSPLIIMAISEANSNVDPTILIEQVEAQVISILTAKTLKSLFEERPTFDLKRLLYGSEKLIDSVANLSINFKKLQWPWVQAFLAVTSSSQKTSIPGQSTQQHQHQHHHQQQQQQQQPNTGPPLPQRPHRVLIPIVSMPTGVRDNIQSIISNAVSSNSKNIVFSLLFRIDNKENENDTNNEKQQSVIEQSGDNNQNDRALNSSSSQTDQNLNFDGGGGGGGGEFDLITVCNHHYKHKLKIADIHIILALLVGFKGQLSAAESLWMPVCLPRFNQDAFLHSYISFLNNSNNCLVILSVDRDEFSNCQKARNIIEEKLDLILNDNSLKNDIYYKLSPLVNPILLELQEKLINLKLNTSSNLNNQSSSPSSSSVSSKTNERESEELLLAETKQKIQALKSKSDSSNAMQLQFLWYQTNKQVLWWQRSERKPLNQIMFYVTKKMLQSSLKILWLKLSDNSIFLGWHVATFQLYAQFDATITTNEATEVIQRVTNWIKKEEDNFTIKDYR